jgi:regulator of sirC expression with transglutaminase-like and TPR domain
MGYVRAENFPSTTRLESGTSIVSNRQEVQDLLRLVGGQEDEEIDLAGTALALAALDRPQADLEPYREHLAALPREVGEEAGENPGLQARIDALVRVIVERHGYQGDHLTYDDIQNANLMRVIDRRKGLPVALGILFIHCARKLGWSVVGLNFPGHFLIRLEAFGERAIIDPFNEGGTRSAVDLRDLLKVAAGSEAELTPEYYQPVLNRSILLRLQNNLKLRFLKGDRVDKAVEVIEGMLLFAPLEASLWREAGLLHAHIGNLPAAVSSLERFMELSQNDPLRHQTALLLQQLRSRIT